MGLRDFSDITQNVKRASQRYWIYLFENGSLWDIVSDQDNVNICEKS